MYSTKSTQIPVVVLIFASVLWGLSWLPLKFLNSIGFEGLPLLLASQGILAVLFTPLSWNYRLLTRYWRSLTGIALTGGTAILCFTYALMYGDVIRVMVLFYLLPVWGVLGGKIFLNESPDGVRWLGVFLALSGAFFILGGSSVLSVPPSWIDLLALISGLAFAANNMIFRGATRVPLSTKLAAMFWGCAGLSGLFILLGVQHFPMQLMPLQWAWLLLYALTWLLFANLGSQWAVTQMDAGKSSIIIIVELVAAVISALILTGERLTPIEWVGCFLVVTAAFLEAMRVETFDDTTVTPDDSNPLSQ